MKRKFTNILSLTFIVIRADFGDTVMQSVDYIIKQIDDIVFVDIGSILDFENVTLPASLNHISSLIATAVSGYNNTISIRD